MARSYCTRMAGNVKARVSTHGPEICSGITAAGVGGWVKECDRSRYTRAYIGPSQNDAFEV